MKEIKDKTLWDFCLEYCKAFGRVHDKQRFRNDIALRFYPHDASELYERCLDKRFFVEDCVNIKFRIQIR